MNLNRLLLSTCFVAGLAVSAMAQDATIDPLLDVQDPAMVMDSGSMGTKVQIPTNDAPGSYVAGIWVDPDGCQHWVMDLGIEGMMDSVMTRDGLPVCGRGCGALSGDVLFSSGSATLLPAGVEAVEALAMQLSSQGRSSIGVVGHTDADGSEAANQSLSVARAQAVANVLQAQGISASVAGRGESQPIADNNTVDGKAQNRRVELICQ